MSFCRVENPRLSIQKRAVWWRMYSNPFPIPTRLAPSLERALLYWQGLRRAGNEMPFWDDLNPSDLSDAASEVVLIDVFSDPERFRFNTVGGGLITSNPDEIRHRFLDEIKLSGKLIYLRAQASATVEASEPTFINFKATAGGHGFGRLLMPLT